MKEIRPAHLPGDAAVHYIYPLPGDEALPPAAIEILTTAARSITHVGWGVDMVVGDARLLGDDEVARLPGERWAPVAAGGTAIGLRTPRAGTLDDLMRKHEAFLRRIERDARGEDSFNPVPPLTVFRITYYRRTSDVAPPAFAAFSLLKPDASGSKSFDTPRKTIVVAGMLRHAACNDLVLRALGYAPSQAPGFLHGHGEAPGKPHEAVAGPRLAYLPLPSLESRGGRKLVVGRIRRALITVMGGTAEEELNQVARLLSATTLQDENADAKHNSVALLARLPASDKMVRQYTDPATTWSTVTPVILPGYDDPRKYRQRLFHAAAKGEPPLAVTEQADLLMKLEIRIERLLRKAIRQAGFSDELATHAEIDWRSGGFRPGAELAMRYAFPKKLRRYRRVHVQITWRDASGQAVSVPGPICLGAGRFCGLGLFARE